MQDPEPRYTDLLVFWRSTDIVVLLILYIAGSPGKTGDPSFFSIQFHAVEQTGGHGGFILPASFCDRNRLCVLIDP